ncbi:MAG TPA: PAC2 family protein [Acidimicrobiales bacterium]|nr:PAC2 family protein [Acidimicrobiales bacterium]
MANLYELIDRPELDAPVLILALDGWIDAGLGAANARASLLTTMSPRTVARFDSDELLDHRARRPTMHLVDGVVTGLTWPSVELQTASDAAGSDVLLLVGAEPDHAWGAFTNSVVDLALDLQVRLVVGLGAYPAPVPHTRPTRLAVTASDASLATNNLVRATVDVPAGVQAAIERRAHELGLAAVGLWAQVPHYLAAMPYPAASVALLDGLGDVAGLRVGNDTLRGEADATRQRVDALVNENDEHKQMVAQLEASVDAEQESTNTALGVGPLPSGDELAAELERFLRDQGR